MAESSSGFESLSWLVPRIIRPKDKSPSLLCLSNSEPREKMNEYTQYGIRFEYPEDWQMDDGEAADARTITVNSGETSFWCLSIFEDCPSIESVLDAAIAAFEEEYEEVDVSATEETHLDSFVDQEIVARDVEFVCLELVNTACLRAIAAEQFTLLVLYQGTDFELAQTGRTLERITESLSLT